MIPDIGYEQNFIGKYLAVLEQGWVLTKFTLKENYMEC